MKQPLYLVVKNIYTKVVERWVNWDNQFAVWEG